MSKTMLKHKHKADAPPEEFIKDCETFNIDFNKLQIKVDKIFDKWLNRADPDTGRLYKEKTIGKWLRGRIKAAGYDASTAWRVMKNHKSARRRYVKSGKYTKSNLAKSKISDVTISQEQTPVIFQILPEQYMIQDLASYDLHKRGEIIKYLHEEIERLKTENDRLKRELDARPKAGRHPYVTYREASDYARSHRISSQELWYERIKSSEFPKTIPRRPDVFYTKTGEWHGWRIFFGLDKATLEEKRKMGAKAATDFMTRIIDSKPNNNNEVDK